MASSTFAQLLAAAEEAGIGTYTPSDGNYDLVVDAASGGKTKAGDPKVSLKLKVVGGPDDGKSFWTNYNFIAVKKDGTPNSQGLAITFRDLAAFGAPADVVGSWDADSPTFSDDVQEALVGATVNAEVQVRQSGDYTNINLRKIRSTTPTVAPAAVTSPPANKPF